MKSLNYRVRFNWNLALLLGALSAPTACGKTEGSLSTGESHFLMLCRDTCPGEFDCISGICTVGCDIDGATICRDIFPDAVCTGESVEPGQLAVCDVPCSDDSACSALGAGFACDGAFCRTSQLVGAEDSFDQSVWLESGGLVRVSEPEVPEGDDGSRGMPEGYFRLLQGEELSCLPNELPRLDEVDGLSCGIIELWLPDEPPLPAERYIENCYTPGRHPHHLVSPVSVFEYLDDLGLCEDGSACRDYDICAVNLVERSGDQALIDQCRDASVDASDFETPGFCLVDPALDGMGEELVSHCPAGSERALRPVGEGLPRQSGYLMIACGEDLL